MMTLEEAKQRLPGIWTIYDHPRDFPDWYVVRCWYGKVKDPVAYPTKDLDDARKYCHLMGASFCLLRHANDDPAILESWI